MLRIIALYLVGSLCFLASHAAADDGKSLRPRYEEEVLERDRAEDIRALLRKGRVFSIEGFKLQAKLAKDGSFLVTEFRLDRSDDRRVTAMGRGADKKIRMLELKPTMFPIKGDASKVTIAKDPRQPHSGAVEVELQFVDVTSADGSWRSLDYLWIVIPPSQLREDR
jgi:hypothetical protein